MTNTIFLSISEHGGWTVAFVGYSIVFMALLCLIVIFSQLPKLINLKTKADLRRKGKHVSDKPEDYEVEGDVNAAISMALHMYFNEMHDDEPTVMTINRTQRRYSPWSSKIYNVYNTPVK